MRLARVVAVLEPGGAQLAIARVSAELRHRGIQTRVLAGSVTRRGIELFTSRGIEIESWSEQGPLATADALNAARTRSWENALAELAAGYARPVGARPAGGATKLAHGVAVTGSEDSSLDGIPGFAQGARRRSSTNIDHPAEVGRLLHDAGYDDEVVAAGLLHDVIEDTETGLAEVGDRFGPRVAELVCVMTEDASIADYEDRKAEHRARVAANGSPAAAIYAADKLAKTRALHHDGGGNLSEAKLDHYRRTLIELREAHPELPFLEELEEALQDLDADRQHAARS
jgi:hypothetical protein